MRRQFNFELSMVDPHGNALPLQDVYRSCTDYAFKQVITGAADYNTAVRRATKNLVEKGVRVIEYESGVHTSVEAAVRRNIMGGLGLMQEQINAVNHDDFGCDGWEISAHANSAPDHEPIQGKQYTDAAYESLNNSLVRRIGTLNCGHAAFPIIMGVTPPQYTKEELEKFREDNEKGVTYDGKHYTGYEATQLQRKLERAIRKQKKRVLVDESTGDEEKLLIDRVKLQRLRQEYKRFSKTAGLRTQDERAQVVGFGRKQAKGAYDAAEKSFKNILEIAENGGKIVLDDDMESYIASKPFSKIQPLRGKLSDRAARKWYLVHDSEIVAQIDRSLSVEDQARQACNLRNQNRTHARDLMRDQKKRQQLDRDEPNKSFEELIADKMARKGLTYEEAVEDILATATKTRKKVNKQLGLE